MFKKETTDKKYHEDPFRAVNFPIGEDGIMRCPNGKSFYLQYRKNVKGNKYGRQEEVYQCEDCSGCPYAEQCKKTDKNRTVRLNHELTSMHQEVIENLESIKGALLRMNRSIQAEGTFGIIKNDRWYKRIVRRGIKSVLLEVFLVSIGHNLYKYHNKQKKVATAAQDSIIAFLWGKGEYTLFYKKDGAENWEKTESDYFVVSEPGKYDVKVVDVAGNESEIQKKETNPADSPECWEKIYNPEPSQWYSYGNSNVNEPKLKGNMTPIRYIGVVAEGANTTNNWANTITADGSMWVWIPRYAYKITYYTDSNYTTTTTNKTQYGKIDVAFVKYENGQNMFLNSTDSGEITSDPTEVGAGTEKWLVHPAFINDSSNNFANGGWDRELSGIWVGKFEATGTKIKNKKDDECNQR